MLPDPATYLIDADLSRADLRVLHAECWGKRVVEFGAGGSTLYLAQIATELVSYETDERWCALVRRELVVQGRHSQIVQKISCASKIPSELPQADVYFVDGVSKNQARARWVKRIISEGLSPVILIHDSRREHPTNELMDVFSWPSNAQISSAEFHVGDSNMLRISLRERPVQYVDWKKAETGRVSFGSGRMPENGLAEPAVIGETPRD